MLGAVLYLCDDTVMTLIRALLLSPTFATTSLGKESSHCTNASHCLKYLAIQTKAESAAMLIEKYFSVMINSIPTEQVLFSSHSANWLFFNALVRTAPRAAATMFDSVVGPIIITHAGLSSANLEMRIHALRWACRLRIIQNNIAPLLSLAHALVIAPDAKRELSYLAITNLLDRAQSIRNPYCTTEGSVQVS